MVSMDEFLKASNSKDFEHDEGWDPFHEDENDRIDPDQFRVTIMHTIMAQ